jgi:hypothetical protein
MRPTRVYNARLKVFGEVRFALTPAGYWPYVVDDFGRWQLYWMEWQKLADSNRPRPALCCVTANPRPSDVSPPKLRLVGRPAGRMRKAS